MYLGMITSVKVWFYLVITVALGIVFLSFHLALYSIDFPILTSGVFDHIIDVIIFF